MFDVAQRQRQRRMAVVSALILVALLIIIYVAATISPRPPTFGTIAFLAGFSPLPLVVAWIFHRMGLSQAALETANSVALRVPAQVIGTHIEEFTEEKELGTQTLYRPLVRYAYTVGGEHFEADRLSADEPPTVSRKHAESTIAEYREGMKVTALVNPNDPTDAVLRIRTPRPRPYFNLATALTALSGAMVVIAAALLIVR